MILGLLPNRSSSLQIFSWPLILAFIRLVVPELSTQSISKLSEPYFFLPAGLLCFDKYDARDYSPAKVCIFASSTARAAYNAAAVF